MRQTFILLLAVLMLLAGNAAATGTTYNQTFADTDNGGSNIWTSITSGYYTYWAGTGGSLPIFIVNTSTTTSKNGINITIHSGPFIQGVMGDRVYTLTANRTYILGPFDLSRFKQLNGTLLVQSNATRGKAIVVSVAS